MANDVMIAGDLRPSTKFAQSKVSHDDLGAGIQAAFAVISYKGKVWRVKHRGEEQMLMRPDEPGVPKPFIECVIVKASPVIAKIYYKGQYAEGDMSPPDCWSVNGVAPDPASPLKQSPTCAGCPMNAWGSKITANGKATKACQDSKRLAIVPDGDLANELYGGPMLLRVPPASLADLSAYGAKLKQIGADYFSVVTRIGFDANEAFPKFTFAALRGLNDDEADVILPMQEDPRVTRILQEAVDHVRAEPAGAPPPTDAKPAPGTTGAPVQKAGDKADDLAIPEHLKRPATTTTTQKPAASGLGATTVVTKGTAPATAPASTTAAQPEMTAEQKEIAELQAKLAKLQGGAPATNGAAATTTVNKRKARDKTATPTTPPPSPQPTPEPTTAPATATAEQAPAANAGAAEALQSIENELDNLL